MIRIDKYLADMGMGTRSEIKKAMRKGIVSVNGKVIKDSSYKVDEEQEIVYYDDMAIPYQKYAYFLLNKPEGYVSSTRDSDDTVLDLIFEPFKGLFPCGRLDKDTTGLLLITNDGQLAHRLLSPNHHVEKEYLVHSAKPLSKEDIALFESGISIEEGEVLKPAIVQETGDCEYHLIIKEGKYHQIKRMFEAVDNEVVHLHRLRMKNLVLDDGLEPGDYRPLTEEELQDLKEE